MWFANKASQIQHACNYGKVTILTSPVDGDRETHHVLKIVYQYQGCFWYADISHISPNMYHPVKKCPMKNIYEKAMARTQQLHRAGYTVVSIWECQWKEKLKKNPDIARIVI